MKKLISFVMATVLCLGMTTAVMATPSADTGTVSPSTKVEASTTIGGAEVNLVEGAVTTTVSEQKDQMAALNNVTLASNAYVNSIKLELPTGYTNADIPTEGILVTIKDAGMSSKMTNVVAVTLPSGSTTWEKAVVEGWGDGYITLRVYHFSEFAWSATPAPVVNPPAPQPQPETPVAPKTADVAMFGMVAMAALAGTVTAARKAKESK